MNSPAPKAKAPSQKKANSRQKPPVVMIHGAFCGPWSFDGFRTRFEKAGYEVHVPTLRFHDGGKPPAALGTTSLVDYTADLLEMIATMKQPPILVGHSLGGLLAQILAARREIRAAVLLAPSAPWGVPPTTLFEIAAAQSMLLQVGFWSQVLSPDLDIAGAHSLNRYPAGEREGVFKQFVPESGRAMFEIMHWGMDMSRASEVDTRQVKCPLLFLSGGDDRINPPDTVKRIAGLYRGNAAFENFRGMSHWLIGEPGWEKIADRALAWLGTL